MQAKSQIKLYPVGYVFDASYDLFIQDTPLRLHMSAGTPWSFRIAHQCPGNIPALGLFSVEMRYALNNRSYTFEVIPTSKIKQLKKREAGKWHTPLKKIAKKTFHDFFYLHNRLKKKRYLSKSPHENFKIVPDKNTTLFAKYELHEITHKTHAVVSKIFITATSTYEVMINKGKNLSVTIDAVIQKGPISVKTSRTYKSTNKRLILVSPVTTPEISSKQQDMIQRIANYHAKQHLAHNRIHKKMKN